MHQIHACSVFTAQDHEARSLAKTCTVEMELEERTRAMRSACVAGGMLSLAEPTISAGMVVAYFTPTHVLTPCCCFTSPPAYICPPTHPPPNDHPLTFVDSIEPGVIPQAVSAVKALLSQLSEGVETQAEEVLSQLKEVRSRIRVGALDRGGAK